MGTRERKAIWPRSKFPLFNENLMSVYKDSIIVLDVTRLSRRRLSWCCGFLLPLPLAIIGCYLWEYFPSGVTTGCGLVLVALLLCCSATDWAWQRIPNWATYPAFAWALVLNAIGARSIPGEGDTDSVLGMDWAVVPIPPLGAVGLGQSLWGAGICFGIMALCTGWLRTSGGDVKLATVIGAFLGVRLGILALCFAYILAGVAGALICLWHYGAFRILRDGLQLLGHWIAPLRFERPRGIDAAILNNPIPLGGYFAIGTLLAMTPIPRVTILYYG